MLSPSPCSHIYFYIIVHCIFFPLSPLVLFFPFLRLIHHCPCNDPLALLNAYATGCSTLLKCGWEWDHDGGTHNACMQYALGTMAVCGGYHQSSLLLFIDLLFAVLQSIRISSFFLRLSLQKECGMGRSLPRLLRRHHNKFIYKNNPIQKKIISETHSTPTRAELALVSALGRSGKEWAWSPLRDNDLTLILHCFASAFVWCLFVFPTIANKETTRRRDYPMRMFRTAITPGLRRSLQRPALLAAPAAMMLPPSSSSSSRPHLTAYRWSSTAHTSSPSDPATPPPASASGSAVDVENFTLVEEIVKRDMEYLARWNGLAGNLEAARAARDYAAVLRHATEGLRLLGEVGADNAPAQCEPLLCLEGAQAHVQLQQYAEAQQLVQRAEAALELAKPECRDMAMLSECQLLRAHILTLEGKGTQAQEVLEGILQWIEVDAKSAPPIQAVAAMHLKRSVRTALGTAIVCQAKALTKRGEDLIPEAKKLFGKALDILIDGLDQHIDEKDSVSVKRSLENIFYCFEGVGDTSQALATCKKYISWCNRQKDEAGVAFGEQLQLDFCRKHPRHKSPAASQCERLCNRSGAAPQTDDDSLPPTPRALDLLPCNERDLGAREEPCAMSSAGDCFFYLTFFVSQLSLDSAFGLAPVFLMQPMYPVSCVISPPPTSTHPFSVVKVQDKAKPQQANTSSWVSHRFFASHGASRTYAGDIAPLDLDSPMRTTSYSRSLDSQEPRRILVPHRWGSARSPVSPDLVPEGSATRLESTEAAESWDRFSVPDATERQHQHHHQPHYSYPALPPGPATWSAALPFTWPPPSAAVAGSLHPPPPIPPAEFLVWYEEHMRQRQADSGSARPSGPTVNASSVSVPFPSASLATLTGWDEAAPAGEAGEWPTPQDIPMPSAVPPALGPALAASATGLSLQQLHPPTAPARAPAATWSRQSVAGRVSVGTSTTPETTTRCASTQVSVSRHGSTHRQNRSRSHNGCQKRREGTARSRVSSRRGGTSTGSSVSRVSSRSRSLSSRSYAAVVAEARSLYRRLCDDYEAFQQDPQRFHEERQRRLGLVPSQEENTAPAPAPAPAPGQAVGSAPLTGPKRPQPIATPPSRDSSVPPPAEELPCRPNRTPEGRAAVTPLAAPRSVASGSGGRPSVRRSKPTAAPEGERRSTERAAAAIGPRDGELKPVVSQPVASRRSELYDMLFQLEGQWKRLQAYKQRYGQSEGGTAVDRGAVLELIRNRKTATRFADRENKTKNNNKKHPRKTNESTPPAKRKNTGIHRRPSGGGLSAGLSRGPLVRPVTKVTNYTALSVSSSLFLMAQNTLYYIRSVIPGMSDSPRSLFFAAGGPTVEFAGATEELLQQHAAAVENFWVQSDGCMPANPDGEADSPQHGLLYGIADARHGHRLVPVQQQRVSLGAALAVLYISPLMRRQLGHLDGPVGPRSSVSSESAAASVMSSASDAVQQQHLEERLEREALAECSAWCHSTVGVVGEPPAPGDGLVTRAEWGTPEGFQAIVEQLEFAAFLGLAAVLVPVPVPAPAEDGGVSFCAARVACRAADALLRFVQGHPTVKVWLSCDVALVSSTPAEAETEAPPPPPYGAHFHRCQFHHVREAMLYGFDPVSYQPLYPTAAATRVVVRREAIGAVLPFLRFSGATTAPLVSSEWLGEPVAGFELLPALLAPPHGLPAAAAAIAAAYPAQDQLWARPLPPSLSVLHMVVELLRRRSIPVISGSVTQFFATFVRLRYLSACLVRDPNKDAFMTYENTLQLPLQPLGHQLASGVYEVFERDAPKYNQYRLALEAYVEDWKNGRIARHRRDDPTLYVVVLGCGRGPLIRECLAACTKHQVRAHIFAIEKNRSAAAYTAWRWATAPECLQQRARLGHVVEVLHADGARVFEERRSLHLPATFGWCDVVVSELLGSLGDNELSPECIEGFADQLRQLWAELGIPPSEALCSVPQSYTAWAAPLHSTTLESALAETCIKGLSVCPPHCDDRHRAIYHELLVCNVGQGIALVEPQPLWTFRHFETGSTDGQREARLTFEVPVGGRVSGVIGYFDAVLYQPATAASPPITLSTRPGTHTPGMFSWFPCFLPRDPRDLAIECGAATVALSGPLRDNTQCRAVNLCLRRVVRREEKRAWYEWRLSSTESETDMEKATLMNASGWAASIYLERIAFTSIQITHESQRMLPNKETVAEKIRVYVGRRLAMYLITFSLFPLFYEFLLEPKCSLNRAAATHPAD
eukprot:gene10083-7053_t